MPPVIIQFYKHKFTVWALKGGNPLQEGFIKEMPIEKFAEGKDPFQSIHKRKKEKVVNEEKEKDVEKEKEEEATSPLAKSGGPHKKHKSGPMPIMPTPKSETETRHKLIKVKKIRRRTRKEKSNDQQGNGQQGNLQQGNGQQGNQKGNSDFDNDFESTTDWAYITLPNGIDSLDSPVKLFGQSDSEW